MKRKKKMDLRFTLVTFFELFPVRKPNIRDSDIRAERMTVVGICRVQSFHENYDIDDMKPEELIEQLNPGIVRLG